MFTSIARRWLPVAFVCTVLSLTVYLVAQQEFRHAADDPQLQIADDIADALASGASPAEVVPAHAVAIGRSGAPFAMVLDDRGAVLASSGGTRTVPAGVLDHVRAAGVERVTWQPRRGVRLATVVRRTYAREPGFIVVGRSLRDTEDRIGKLGSIVLIGWAIAMFGSLMLAALYHRADFDAAGRSGRPRS